jgi:hypothetical protein
VTAIAFSEAASIYECCVDTEVQRHVVRHQGLRAYSKSLRNLLRRFADVAQEDDWKPLMRFFRVYRYRVSVAPLPFCYAFADLQQMLRQVSALVRRWEAYYPGSGELAQALLRQYQELSALRESPLLGEVRALLAEMAPRNTALAVRDSHLVPHTEAVLQGEAWSRSIEVVVPQLLRSPARYDALVLIGPASWFPDAVLSSPRSRHIHVVHYDWAPDEWRARLLLSGGVAERTAPVAPAPTADVEPDAWSIDAPIPEPDWDAVIQGSSAGELPSAEQQDVDARLYSLDEGCFTFLDASDSATAFVIDLQSQVDDDSGTVPSVLRHVPAADVRPGMFLVLRTRGGGDYIAPLADILLGDRAQEYRDAQAQWKGALRQAVDQHGMDAICGRLAELGARLGSEGNVRNWMSSDSIRPRYSEDFSSVLRLIGMDADARRFFRAAAAIRAAHRRAGFRIRQILMTKVRAANLRQLEKAGRMDFDLGESEGGMLSALRVRGVRPGTVRVPASRLLRLLAGRSVSS